MAYKIWSYDYVWKNWQIVGWPNLKKKNNVFLRLLETATGSINLWLKTDIKRRSLSHVQVILTSFWKCWRHNLYYILFYYDKQNSDCDGLNSIQFNSITFTD